MSRKSFIITALIINLTICLTLCIVLFTDKNRNGNVKETSGTIADNSAENSGDITADNNESETTKESSDYKETTTKIIESQVSADTPPVTYKKAENENQTTSAETTSAGIPFSGTMAVINSSCNIRSSADVRGNVIGTANAGTSYRIDPAKCNSDWIAIYLDDTTIGYISTTFCSVN